MLLELRRRRALDRPVAAVVDARGELVDHRARPAGQLEQLHGQHARPGPGRGRSKSAISAASKATIGWTGAGATVSARIPRSWRLRATGNASGAPGAVAGAHDRQLGLEGDLALEQQRVASSPPRDATAAGELGGTLDPQLAAAVVPAERDLEPDRVAEIVRGGRAPPPGRGPRGTARRARRSSAGIAARRAGPGSPPGRGAPGGAAAARRRPRPHPGPRAPARRSRRRSPRRAVAAAATSS